MAIVLLKGPEYALSKQKRLVDLTMAHAMSPARSITHYLLLREFRKYQIDNSLIIKQPRIGQDGVPFMMEKFRTLQPGDNKTPISSLTDFMRRTGLDETQQIAAIQRGQMSFVGHRCLLPKEHYEVYERCQSPKLVDRHRSMVLPTRPGNISSWGIVSHLGHADGPDLAELRLELDIKDVMDGSIVYDLELSLNSLYLAVANKFTHGAIRADEALR